MRNKIPPRWAVYYPYLDIQVVTGKERCDWCHLPLDLPELTQPKYGHQN